MSPARFEEILAGFGQATVVVVGDFFLDKYLEIEPALAEVSLETGLEARQVVAIRCQPGGAGTVVANLCALGAGKVKCLGLLGDDGEGFELTRALRRFGADTEGLLVQPDKLTPTYCKPMLRLPTGGLRELERLDHRSRRSVSQTIETKLIKQLKALAPDANAIIAQDQIPEPECGVITTNMRKALAALCEANPNLIGFADSRLRIGAFRNMILKPNQTEAQAAASGKEDVFACARELSRRTKRPVFLTIGEEGIAVVTQETWQQVPTVKLTGELDIVGAGDSATAGAVLALCAGAELTEAAIIANLVASITVQQIGTTGTATQAQIKRRFAENEQLWKELPPPCAFA